MGNVVDGSGIYRQDAILGPFPEIDEVSGKVLIPQIEELRMIRGPDGEDYINVKDMTIAMTQVAFSMPLPTINVLGFIKRFAIELATARR